MSLPRIRDEFRVPARLGARVTVEALDRAGTVIGNEGDNLVIRVDGIRAAEFHVHPHNLQFHTMKEKAA